MNSLRLYHWKWLLLGLAMSVMAASGMPARGGDPPRHITVVSDGNFPPFLFVGADGKPRGYVADVWRLFEAHTGIKVTLISANWTESQRMLASGQADVLETVFRTPAREAKWDFSPPYGIALPIQVYADNSIASVHDLASLRGFTVGVQHNDACAEKLVSGGHASVREFAEYADMVQTAADSQIHLFCVDMATANYYLYLNSALQGFRPAFTLYSARLHRAVPKGHAEMLRTIEYGMSLITPAEHQELYDRWLRNPSFAPWPYWSWVKLAVAVVLVTLLLMGLLLWFMRRRVRRHTRELVAARNRLQALFNASPDAISVKDVHGVYLECNNSQLAMFGRGRKEVIGHTDRDLFQADFIDIIEHKDRQVVQTGMPLDYTFRTGPYAGGDRCMEVSKAPLIGEDGRVEAILSVTRDITERERTERDLRLWGHAFMHSAFGVAIFDAPTQTIIAVNSTFAEERGYVPEEMTGMGVDVLYPQDLHKARRAARRIIDAQTHSVVETEQITRSGHRFPVSLECTVLHDDDGHARHVVAFVRDLTEHRKAENELRLAAAAFQTQSALVVMDSQQRIQRVNQAFAALMGYRPEEMLGQSGEMFRGDNLGEDFYRELWGQVAREGYWRGEMWVRVKKGQSRVVRATVSAVRDEHGKVIHFVTSMIDLTREMEAHANVDRMTFFDKLTDLPNRNFLVGRLKHLLDEADASRTALVLIDLDHFKRVNDLRGHAAGDRLLLLVAQRLQAHLGDDDVLSRFGGGTFALLMKLPGVAEADLDAYAKACCVSLLNALCEPFQHGDMEPIAITASIGWVRPMPGQMTPEAVLRDAELAMYEAKGNGRNQVLAFEPGMRESMLRMETLTSELRDAIAEQTLELHLQAQTDRSGEVTGAEMLLRWTRRCGERVSPALFIPIAEESGLILPIGEWVLRQACEQLVAWSGDSRKRLLSLAVNVSVRQFAQSDFVDGVQRILEASGADASLLKLEITESVVLGDLEEAATKLRQLQEMGIRVSLDDFGTGYSSLAYLAHLPLDQLKIDQSFVRHLEDDAADAMVAQTIISMGHGLDLEVIAEGVETRAQHDFLLIQGCDAFQGYLFARPVELSVFEQMFEAGTVLP